MKTLQIVIIGLLLSFTGSSGLSALENTNGMRSTSNIASVEIPGISGQVMPEAQSVKDLGKIKSRNLLNTSQRITRSRRTSAGILAFMILLILATGVLVNLGVWLLSLRKSYVTKPNALRSTYFNENSVRMLKGLLFDKTHTWAFMDPKGSVRVGIDDFLQRTTGPITKIKMAEEGEKIKKGGKLLSIMQEGKKLDIYSPVSGTIKKQNELLHTDSQILNAFPYTEGWVYEIEPINWMRESQFMIIADKYGDWIKTEFSRLKDFLAMALEDKKAEPAVIILQDGGELKNWVLEDFGPEVWEDFQTHFIDTNK